uniref:Uncharacterized protein n=1 Tax=Oryza punctata TaxID=4537 RepID=A0A0E0KIP1_ORYPU
MHVERTRHKFRFSIVEPIRNVRNALQASCTSRPFVVRESRPAAVQDYCWKHGIPCMQMLLTSTYFPIYTGSPFTSIKSTHNYK